MVIFATEKFGMQELSEQELIRREKLAKLRELGIDPYPAAAFDISHYATTVSEKFEQGQHVRMAELDLL